MRDPENSISRDFTIRKQKLENIVSPTKMFLNLLGNTCASWETNFVSATMFPEVGKQENSDSN